MDVTQCDIWSHFMTSMASISSENKSIHYDHGKEKSPLVAVLCIQF